MKKKMLALLLTAAMTLSLSACGQGEAGQTTEADKPAAEETTQTTETTEAEPETEETANADGELPVYDEKVTLVLWGAVPAENGPQEAIDNYNELNKDRNIEIEYYRYANDDNGNISLDTALMAGEKMDMFISYSPARRDTRIQSGKVMDITEICQKLDIDLTRDFGSLAADNMVDGKVYTIPTMKYMDLIVYNKDMLDAQNIAVPTSEATWEDLRDIAVKTKTDSVYGMLLNLSGDFFIQPFMSTASESPVPYEKDGKVEWNVNPQFKEAYQFVYDMMYTEKCVMDWPTMLAEKISEGGKSDIMFLSGQAAANFTGTHVIRNIINRETYPHDFVTAFAPIPKFNAQQGEYYAAVQANDHIAVNTNCEYPEEAVRFIKWYATEGYDPMIKNGRLPLYQNYDADRAFEIMIGDNADLIDAESFKNTVFGQYDNFNVPITDENKATVSKISKEESEAYFLDQITLDEMLANLQTRTEELMQ